MFGPIIIICAVLFAGTGAGVSNLKAARNTTVELTCIAPSDALFPPAWVMNGSLLLADDGYTTSRDEDTGELIGTLIINGNHSCGTFHAYCRLYSGSIMHNTTLTFEGRLPSPENIHINESNSSLFMRWNPPYSANNTELSFVHVDPHITQYTVYIVDNFTGDFMEAVNVTETLFQRSISDDNSCSMYRVTAWNSGGEGDMSVPLPGAPKSIAAEDIDIHREAGALDIHLHVSDPCTVRIPNSFLVTVMSTDGMIITTVQHPVATVRMTTIRVTLPQNDDDCKLIVRISAGNSAGVSSPTNITVGCPTTDYSTDTTTTTSIGSDTTSTDLVDQSQQEDIIYIAVGISVGAVVIVAVGALLLIILWRCKRTKKVQPPEENVYNKKEEKRNTKEHAENDYVESPLPRRPPVHRSDPPPAVVDATTESHSGISSTESSGSDKISESTGLVYTSIDPEKHNQPQSPASDNNQVQ